MYPFLHVTNKTENITDLTKQKTFHKMQKDVLYCVCQNKSQKYRTVNSKLQILSSDFGLSTSTTKSNRNPTLLLEHFLRSY